MEYTTNSLNPKAIVGIRCLLLKYTAFTVKKNQNIFYFIFYLELLVSIKVKKYKQIP